MELSSPVKMVLALLPLAALASAVAWLVYAIKFGEDIDNNVIPDTDKEAARSTLAFQGVVATVLLYFAAHHGLSQL